MVFRNPYSIFRIPFSNFRFSFFSPLLDIFSPLCQSCLRAAYIGHQHPQVRGSMNIHKKAKGGQKHSFILAVFIILFALLACKENDSDDQETAEGKSVAEAKGAADTTAPACVCSAKKIDRESLIFQRKTADGQIKFYTINSVQIVPQKGIDNFRLQTEAFLSTDQYKEMGNDPISPISDPGLEKRFEEAKQLVLSLRPACAWRWDEVKALIGKHGGRIIYEGAGKINPYDPERTAGGRLQSLLFVSYLQDRKGLEPTKQEMALDMVRVATLVVYEGLLMEWAGYNMGHLQMADLACQNYAFFKRHLGIMLRVWNAYRARQAMYGKKFIPDDDLPTVERALRAFDRGEDGKFLALTGRFADEAIDTEARRELSQALGRVGQSGPCDFPPMFSAVRAGRAFFPFDAGGGKDGLVNLLEKRFFEWLKKP
jgi:hypothetical protein